MADPVGSLLADDERLVIDVKQHWVALIRAAPQPILIAIGALLVGAISFAISGEDPLELVALGLFAVATVWLPIQIVRWKTRRYVLTNRRVIESSGLMRRTTTDAGLDTITEVSVQQP